MSSRKEINKHYPVDFDPRKVPRRTAPKNNQTKIRNMVAMTIQCKVCGEFIFSGKKLNSRKEPIENDDYLGMKNYRFYVRCTRCASELTFKTDYENSRYVCETNCKSIHDNIVSTRESEETAEMVHDGMKKLEQRMKESLNEMDNTDMIEDLYHLSKRREVWQHLKSSGAYSFTNDESKKRKIETELDENEIQQFLTEVKSLQKENDAYLEDLDQSEHVSPSPQGDQELIEKVEVVISVNSKKKKKKVGGKIDKATSSLGKLSEY